MGVDITITTPRAKYQAGELVQGTVSVSVSESDGTSAEAVVIELIGKAKAHVVYYTHQSRNVSYKSEKFLKFDTQLGSFGGHAPTGVHTFPFGLQLPATIPSSMKESRGDGSCCKIYYTFKARLHRPGIVKFDVRSKHVVEVSAKPQTFELRPVIAGPASTVVKTLGLVKRGSMSVAFKIDRAVASHDEVMGITVAAQNDSSVPVKEVCIEIRQKTRWSAYYHHSRKRRVVAHIVVSGSQMGDIGRPAEKGSDRGRTDTDVANSSRVELQQLLQSGGGTRFELVIPQDCLHSVNTEMISVRHKLEVRLKTSSFVTSPKIATPLILQSAEMPQDNDVPAESAADIQQIPTAVAVVSPDFTVGAQGRLTSLLVPQDNVKTGFYVMPDPSIVPDASESGSESGGDESS